MRIAIPTWKGRVAPLFDTASRLLVVEVDEEGEYSRFETDISEHFLHSKAMRLREMGIDTLICGAISEQGARMIATTGIALIPWISGQVKEVLQAFLRGNSLGTQFLMSGHPDYWDEGPGRAKRGRGLRFP